MPRWVVNTLVSEDLHDVALVAHSYASVPVTGAANRAAERIASLVYVGSVSAQTIFVIGKVVGNRVTEADELEGLDLPEMGIEGYSPEYRQTAAQFEYR